MTETGSASPTLLIVQISGAGHDAEFLHSDEMQVELQALLASMSAVLDGADGCRRTERQDNRVLGLFADADCAYEGARCLQDRLVKGAGQALPAPIRLLLSTCNGDTSADLRAGEQADRTMRMLPVDRIFATDSVASQLSGFLRARFHLFDRDGVDEPTRSDLFEAVFCEEPTTVFAAPQTRRGPGDGDHTLMLRWRDRTVTLHPDSAPFVFGRGGDSDAQIESSVVSRHHAHLDFRHTNFILADQSTNGTFVRIENAEEVFLHHEQIVLRGNGVISLGRRTAMGGGKLIYFAVTG